MKRYFVSFAITGEKSGFGYIGLNRTKNIFSIDDVNGIRDYILEQVKKEAGDDNVGVTILNWRRYEFSLALWIKDIFNKIRGRK